MNNQDTRFANQYAIQWFPGHMAKTLRMMEQEIQHVDASLVLLDARIPLSSLNPEIERITARKPKLYALNKADLADPAVTEEWIRRGLCRHQRQAERRRERRQGRDRKGTVRPAGTPPEPRHGRCQDAGHALRHP
jgi:ribosome biogenesis GTPase A